MDPYSAGGSLLNPFLTEASAFLPDNPEEAMRYALLINTRSSDIRAGARFIVSHFCRPLQVLNKSLDHEAQKSVIHYYDRVLGIQRSLRKIGEDLHCYGNAYVYIAWPFDRILLAEGKEIALARIPESNVRFNISDMTYSIVGAPHIAPEGIRFKFRDRIARDPSRVRIRTLDPARVQLRHNQWSGLERMIWRIEERFRSKVRQGRVWHVNSTPIGLLQAIQENKDFMFHEGECLHLALDSYTGLSKYGLGVPPVFLNYDSVHRNQMYQKADQEVADSFLIPRRFISPSPQTASGDAAARIDYGEWAMNNERMNEEWHYNPGKFFTSPIPIQVAQIGGDARMFSPKDLLENQSNSILRGMNIPADLYNYSIQLPLMPSRIEMFERAHEETYDSLQRVVSWVSKKLAGVMGSEDPLVELPRPNDNEKLTMTAAYMQLAAGGQIGKRALFKGLGIDLDPREEELDVEEDQVRQAESQIRVEEKIKKLQKNKSLAGTVEEQKAQMAAQQQGQAAPEPSTGGPVGSAAAPAKTPEEINRQAGELASRWQQMHQQGQEREKLQDMNNVKATNPTLYAVALQQLENLRRQGASQGRQQAGAQPQQ
jgi:hypothetical protein